MGLLDKLKDSALGLKGKTPEKLTGSKHSPYTEGHSQLDLDAKTPAKYTDNLPK